MRKRRLLLPHSWKRGARVQSLVEGRERGSAYSHSLSLVSSVVQALESCSVAGMSCQGAQPGARADQFPRSSCSCLCSLLFFTLNAASLASLVYPRRPEAGEQGGWREREGERESKRGARDVRKREQQPLLSPSLDVSQLQCSSRSPRVSILFVSLPLFLPSLPSHRDSCHETRLQLTTRLLLTYSPSPAAMPRLDHSSVRRSASPLVPVSAICATAFLLLILAAASVDASSGKRSRDVSGCCRGLRAARKASQAANRLLSVRIEICFHCFGSRASLSQNR